MSYGTRTFTYPAGQLTSMTDGATTTTYDYAMSGELRTVDDGTMRIEYEHDGFGRRVGKSVDGNLVQGFLYQDALNPIAKSCGRPGRPSWAALARRSARRNERGDATGIVDEFRRRRRRCQRGASDGSPGRPQLRLDATGAVRSRFVYATRGHVPDYMIQGGREYHFVTDHLGSVRHVIDTADGTIAQRLDYDEFGNVLSDSNPGFQPFAFAGGLYDRDTGLTRFGVRDYDPSVGRWTARDAIEFRGAQWNLFVYSRNSPQNFIDLTGRGPILVIALPALVGGLLNAAFHWDQGPRAQGAAFIVGATGGAVAGGVGSLVAGGFVSGFIGTGVGAAVAKIGNLELCLDSVSASYWQDVGETALWSALSGGALGKFVGGSSAFTRELAGGGYTLNGWGIGFAESAAGLAAGLFGEWGSAYDQVSPHPQQGGYDGN